MASLAAASPEVYMSAEELAEEIEYQKVLLLSLDDTVIHREKAEAEIKAEIRWLETQLKALKQGQHNSIASALGNMPSSRDDDPFRPLDVNTATKHTIPATPSTGSTPNSVASAFASNNLLSPSQLNLPTRKRSHAEHLGHIEFENKFRRTSPSPGVTRSATPSTSSGQDYHVLEDGFFDLTGVDDSVHREAAKFRQRQREAEEKANRERDDAELARMLQSEYSGIPTSSNVLTPVQSSAAPAGPSAFDRLFGRPPLSQSEAPLLRNPGASGIPSITQSFNQHPIASPSSFAPDIKDEPNPVHPAIMPGTFQESDSDSDIEIISSNAFNDNRRQTSSSGSHPQYPLPSSLLPGIQVHNFSGSVCGNNTPHSRSQFSSVAEAVRHAALQRMQDKQQRDAHIIQQNMQQLESLARHRQLGTMSTNPTTANGGMALPPPPGMSIHPFGHSPFSQHTGFSGNNLYGGFGGLPGSTGLSGPGSLSNQDPLSHMIFQASGYNLSSMTDIHGNSIIPGMPEINALNGRLSEISDYVNDPRRTSQEIQNLLENIRPDVEIPKENREGTPDGLKYALYEHQKLALTWLKQMEEGTNKGGILADDMGLGKTISALALILSRPSQDRRRKTTLIVGPVALVRQWEREIATKVNRSHCQSTFLYHSGKKATWETLRTYDIVLTTYGTLGAEFKRQQEWMKKCDQNPNLDRDSMRNKFPFLGDDSLWYRVILDEAQCIKNKSTKAAQGACYLKSLTRFCLTGTPMMNGVHELYSLIHFLRIKPYNEYQKFNSDFGCLSRSGGARGSVHPQMEKNAMKKLQAVLKAILLRRTKTSKIDGEPILTLPEKTEEIVHAIFNEDEQAYYTALETKTKILFNKYLKANTIGKNYSNILVLLLRLRQAACHPHLIMDFEEAPTEATAEDMVGWAKSLAPDVVRRITQATLPFECPVCYDPVPNPRIVIPCGHDTCSECLVKIACNVQQEAIAEGDESGIAKCPSCRGKVDIKKIIDYVTFKQVHMQEEVEAAVDDETQSEDDGESISDLSDTDDDETDSEGSDKDIRDFIVPDGYMSSDEENVEDDEDEEGGVMVKKKGKSSQGLDISSTTGNGRKARAKQEEEEIKDEVKEEDDDDFVDVKDIKPSQILPRKGRKQVEEEDDEDFIDIKDIKPTKRSSRKDKTKAKVPRKSRRRSKGKEKAKNPQSKHISLAVLKKEAMRSVEGHRRYMRYLRKNWVSSAKVDKCLDILRDTEPDIKTIIFSQFTTLLDLVEVPIRQEKWGFMRYDGSMSGDARHHAVVKFTDDPRCKIMLVSLKAGNAGLNLVAASQVIILDPFWNPFIEMQAVDRAHRIGQQKQVKVHRILVEKTVEDRIIDLQNKKRKLVEAALDEKASQGLGRLGRQELIYLFNGGGERETAPRPNHGFGLGTGSSTSPSPSPSD